MRPSSRPSRLQDGRLPGDREGSASRHGRRSPPPSHGARLRSRTPRAGAAPRPARRCRGRRHERRQPDASTRTLRSQRRDRQHVVAAVHQPGREALDDEPPVLEDAAAQAERGDDAETVVHVVASASARAASRRCSSPAACPAGRRAGRSAPWRARGRRRRGRGPRRRRRRPRRPGRRSVSVPTRRSARTTSRPRSSMRQVGVVAHQRVRGVAGRPDDQLGVELLAGRQHHVAVVGGDAAGCSGARARRASRASRTTHRPGSSVTSGRIRPLRLDQVEAQLVAERARGSASAAPWPATAARRIPRRRRTRRRRT